ncbi:MAG: hypothetical protein ACK5MD_09825 [Flavobacteriales bacterium]
MKNTLLISWLFLVSPGFAQDGSDIIYVKNKTLDSTYLGKFVQIDFYNESFGGLKLDTVNLKISDHQKFKEVRNDNGFNNWFSQQYLESIEEKDSTKFRIQKFKLLAINKDSLVFKSFGHYFKEQKEIFSRFITDTITLDRKIIHQILVNANPQIKKGISIYRVYTTQQNESECHYCFDATEENVFNNPLIDDWQIEKFDYENQTIKLTESGKREIEKLEIPLRGMPVVLTLNGEIIYGFWFWNMLSSFGCDRVYTYPKWNFSIKFGLPKDFKYGNDPRFDERLKKYCNEKYQK